MLKQTTSVPKMHKAKSAEERIVYKLSKNTVMKFRPQRVVEDSTSGGFISRIRSLSKYFSRQKDTPTLNTLRKSNELDSSKPNSPPSEGLRFLFRLDCETFLIGNTHQLDAINLSIVEDYIESEQLWTMRPKSNILNLLVDDRRKAIIVVISGEIIIYSYEGKRSKNPPKPQKTFRVLGEIKMMQLAKDSLLTIFFEDSVHSYYLDGANSRQYSRKQYKVDKTLSLFQLAQCIQNVLNVFFWCPSKTSEKVFELWCMPIELFPQKSVVGQIKKIYEIEYIHKDTLKIESITKDAYFMNLGQTILMFRKGYCVDKVFINLKVEGTLLKYFGDKKLIHISPLQIDFYNVVIDLVSNPPKLSIQSFDSINNLEHQKYAFLDAIKFQQHKIAFFYQLPFLNSSGEVKYFFILTQKWKLEEKIDSILPRISEYNGKYDGEQFKKLLKEIQVSCDVVGKMGMSRKQAYLRIWRQSKKEHVEEFKLLLDTLDYNTIREEILLKLRKKSMLFNQVHKIQSGCLGMISQNVFGAKGFSIEELKNYLISHFLIRKLQLFKEMRLFEKKYGKVKLTDSEINDKSKDKLYINIQEYTNAVKMDIKSYLLEMIYNFAKYKKDLATQIRIVIKKFKFTFLFIYESFIKEVVNTVKQDLLYLLQKIPQLLPYVHKPTEDQYETSLKQGIWGKVKDQEWDSALYLQNVVTIYNKDMISDFKNSVWVKRYWLTNHDMIFLNRSNIQAQWNKISGQYIFYNLIQYIFDNYTSHTKVMELIHFIEETYLEFPPHLFNNVILYRELFLYFKKNQVMNDHFQTFLRNNDQEIFKKIFDHQKFKKGSFLKDVKPIYQDLKQSDKFNIGLLKYFSSNLSEVSDIKYLLNRINNEKKEFHDENIEMYEVLVKGMQIKLKLGSEKDIPISQVLIYIENIPLTEDNSVSKELKILQKINQEGEKFKKMKLNMSVFQMIRNRDSVLVNSISFQIESSGLRTHHEQPAVLQKSKQIIDQLTRIRRNIYGPFQDNVILFIFLVKLAQTKQLIPFVPQIIQQNISSDCIFDNGHLQNVVLYCYRQKMISQPVYSKSQEYLQALIQLLPEDNSLRIFIRSQISLALIFSEGGKQTKFPICGESGLITKHQLQGMLQALSRQSLLTIDIQAIYEFSSTMQKITGQSTINLYQLREFHFSCLLKKGALHKAIESIETIINLQPDNINNIIYPIMIFKCISCEFIDQNKSLMINLLALLFKKPHQLLKIYQQLMSKSYSNEQQRDYLSEMAFMYSQPSEQRFNKTNILFNDDFVQYLKQNPDKSEKCVQLFQSQFTHLAHSNQDFSKSIDVLIYHLLLVQEPILLIKYVHLNRYSLNIKEVRSFMSHLCKYEAYDQIKLLEFSKRIFKLLYDVEQKNGNYKKLCQDVLSSSLAETRSIDPLESTTENLNKLAKSVEKFKAKLKYKMISSSALRKRASVSGVGPVSKFEKIQAFLADSQKYFQKNDYPFNDSDGYVEKKQFLIPQKFKQGSGNLCFNYKKYLNWLFNRKNEQIEYYLLKVNELQADEAIRIQEEALKLSFRKSPNDRIFKDNAHIVCKAYEKIVQAKFFEEEQICMLPISAIPNVANSAISVNNIFTEEIEQVFLGTTMLKEEILSSIKIVDDALTFDSKIIQNYGTTQQIESALPELVKEIYNDAALEYGTCTALIRQVYNAYPKMTPINVSFLEIYSKVEQIQKKLGLNLQTRDLLPYQGLLIKDKDCTILFNFIKQPLLPHLNQNNIHTISRIISLSFKKPQFQQQIINEYFKIIVKEYNELESQFDANMKLQKIAAFAQKMPLNHLKLQIEKLIEAISNPQKQRKIIKAISQILRSRNDSKNADLLESKWLNDKQGSPEDVQ